MSYSGNQALSAEIQERILETFRQTLALVESSASQEALLGCDFILRLDPLFEPARTLHERLIANSGTVETDDLRALVEVDQTETPSAVDLFTVDAPADEPQAKQPAAVVENDVEISKKSEAPPLKEAIVAPEPVSAPEPVTQVKVPEEPVTEIPDATAPKPEENIDSGPEPREAARPATSSLPPEESIVSPATEKLSRAEAVAPAAEVSEAPQDVRAQGDSEPPQEAPDAGITHQPDPYLESMIDSANTAIKAENLAEARELLGKAQLLDPENPKVLELEEALAAADQSPDASIGDSPEPVEEESAEADDKLESLENLDEMKDLDQPEVEGEKRSLADLGSALDSESEQRIQDLLAEGQNEFEAGDFQSAIDSWSRIFLIDIDHAEANQRIEEARKLKAESDRELEEAFHEGVVLLDDQKLDEARAAFERVLEMQPNHLAAQQQLEKIESAGKEGAPASGIHVSAVSEDSPVTDETAASFDQELISKPEFSGLEAVDASADPFGELSKPKAKAAKSRMSLYVGAAVLLLVLAGGWILIRNWSSIFPNSGKDSQASVRTAPQDPITRAMGLKENGKTAMALAQLRRLPPENPAYAEAQTLIAQWESKDPSADDRDQPSPAEMERRSNHIQMANLFYQDREFLRVLEHLDAASLVTPLDEGEDSMRQASREALSDIQDQIDLFEQGDWEFAVRTLWNLHQANPDNKDVKRLLIDCYFNLGYRDLQRSDPGGAVRKLTEAVNLGPDDYEATRLLRFAQTYETRAPDLLYQIFIKYQPTR